MKLGRNFGLLLTAAAVSTIGDGIAFTAFPLLAIRLTSNAVAISSVTMAGIVPWILVGPIGGAFADRFDRRVLMIIADIARSTIILGLAFVLLAGSHDLALLLVAAAATCVGSTVFDPASQAIIPDLVKTDQARLGAASTRLFAVELLGQQLTGRALGGALFAASQALPFALDAASFLVSASLILSIRGSYASAPGRDADRKRQSLPSSVWEGAKWLVDHPLLRALTITVGAVNLVFGASEAVLVILARERLRLGPAGYGYLLSGMAAGGMAAALLRGGIAKRLSTSAIIRSALFMMGTGTAIVAVVRGPVASGLGLALTSFAIMLFNVAGMPLRQLLVPPGMRGRVMAAYRVVGMGMAGLGSILGGVVVVGYGVQACFLGGAGIIFLVAVASRVTFSVDAIALAIEGAERETYKRA